jgi:hypothetical protein
MDPVAGGVLGIEYDPPGGECAGRWGSALRGGSFRGPAGCALSQLSGRASRIACADPSRSGTLGAYETTCFAGATATCRTPCCTELPSAFPAPHFSASRR